MRSLINHLTNSTGRTVAGIASVDTGGGVVNHLVLLSGGVLVVGVPSAGSVYLFGSVEAYNNGEEPLEVIHKEDLKS